MHLYPSNDSLPAASSTITALTAASSSSLPDSACRDIDNCRTLYDIVWSCIVTILACTWVAIHPNIPAQDASWSRKLGRRVVTTIYAIIAPECVVVWAAKQCIRSLKLARKYNNDHGWTQTHGFFAIMGEFVIFEGEQPVRVVDPYKDLDMVGLKYDSKQCKCGTRHACKIAMENQVDSRLGSVGGSEISVQNHSWRSSLRTSDNVDENSDNAENDSTHRLPIETPAISSGVDSVPRAPAALLLDISTLPFPDITEREIQDKSKGDWLSKGAAVLQTSWFLVQCVARPMQHLPVTELELVTCAFAVLNAVVYGLWWNKPKDVDCPYAIGRAIRQSHNTDISIQDAERSLLLQASSPGHHEKWRATLRSSPKKVMTASVNVTWGSDTIADDDDWWKILLFVIAIPVCPLANIISGTEISERDKHVNAYYSGDSEDDTPVLSLIAIACSSAFGAIHCIGWSFDFGSRTQQILWRSCSLTITCLPLLLSITGFVVNYLQDNILPDWMGDVLENLMNSIYLAQLIIYGAARIILLVLAFLSLSSLSADAYRTVSWTNYIPHI
ncbi:hypothetical protein OE88DRAFT_233412 [Heliocybe sulcata]|uniref:Uncharacterized protein n=1 Tax=Heliocybe sulcata TaxID=5364 RepID=A0A5C3MYA0_9AGAM|nr:hypothetical protein OE88DRAFT_233412 [Heliocybe sulcata]